MCAALRLKPRTSDARKEGSFVQINEEKIRAFRQVADDLKLAGSNDLFHVAGFNIESSREQVFGLRVR